MGRSHRDVGRSLLSQLKGITMKAKGHAIGRLIVSTTFLGALAFGVIGCDDRLARMEDNQGRLQAMVAANARQIAAPMYPVPPETKTSLSRNMA